MANALVFDSGVGGLSVSAQIRKFLPELQQTYVADDAFRPYGNKTEAQLKSRLPGLLETLTIMLNPDVIVLACNTASTTALKEIRAAVPVPVVGVVPAIKPAAETSQSGRFAVLGTPGTVRRKYVGKLISDFAPDHDVVLLGSTRLVTLAEDKLAGRSIDKKDVINEITPLFANGPVDKVVLACTHFPLLQKEFSEAANELGMSNVKFIDSGQAIARRVVSVLSGVETASRSRSGLDVALLIGPNPRPERAAAFKGFGFKRVVGLCP